MINSQRADKSQIVHLDCQCHCPEHIVRISYWEWPDQYPELFFELQSDCFLPWYKRIWAAIKYVAAGHALKWHDVSVKHQDVDKLQLIINDYNSAYANECLREKNQPAQGV